MGYLIYLLHDDAFAWDRATAFLSDLPYFYYFLLPVLSIASWLIESYKWQWLVRDLRWLRFRESVIHNLTSQATSFITPLRAGEYATKAFYFETSLRPKVLKAVLVGNLSQMTVTVLLGTAGALLLFYNAIAALIFLATSVLLLIIGSPVFARWMAFKAIRLDGVTGISLVRYLMFSSGWWVLLSLVSDAPAVLITSCIATMYLASSMIPSLQVFDVFLKWSIASFFIGYLDISLESMTALVAVLWLNNTVLPVVLGCGLLAVQKFPKLATA